MWKFVDMSGTGPIEKPIKLEDKTPKEAPHKNKTQETIMLKIPENQKKKLKMK